MAEPLPVLIKIAEQKVLKVQKAIADTQTSITNLEFQREQLRKQIKDGSALANTSNNIAMMQQASAFNIRAKAAEEQMAQLRKTLDNQLTGQRAELAKHYAEQKRYETLWSREQAKRKKAHDAKVQNQLDEIAGVAEWMNRKPTN
jgi:flagellar biosynthesis chaperone FliJ